MAHKCNFLLLDKASIPAGIIDGGAYIVEI